MIKIIIINYWIKQIISIDIVDQIKYLEMALHMSDAKALDVH